MKKGLMIAAGIAGAAIIASELVKRLSNNEAAEEKTMDENSAAANESDSADKKCEVKKTKNHNENMVRVNNSLISIKIKAFSK